MFFVIKRNFGFKIKFDRVREELNEVLNKLFSQLAIGNLSDWFMSTEVDHFFLTWDYPCSISFLSFVEIWLAKKCLKVRMCMRGAGGLLGVFRVTVRKAIPYLHCTFQRSVSAPKYQFSLVPMGDCTFCITILVTIWGEMSLSKTMSASSGAHFCPCVYFVPKC